MSEQQEILTGRPGREQDAGYTPLTDAAAPAAEPKTYPAGEEGARQAANDVTAARGGPSELPIIERPYVNPQTGEKIRTKFSVTPEKAGRDLSERHRVEATERQTDAEINLAVSVLEARDRVAAEARERDATPAATKAYSAVDQAGQSEASGALSDILQTGGQPPAQPATAEQPPSDTPPDGISPKVREALEIPEVKAFVDQHVNQAQQAANRFAAAAAAYGQAVNEVQQLLPAAFAVTIPELQGISAEQLPTALHMLAQQNPERFAQVQRQLDHQVAATKALHERSAAIQQDSQQQYAQRFATWASEQDSTFEKQFPEFADKDKAPALRSMVTNYMTKVVGIPEETLPKLWSHDLFRDSMAQRVLYDAARWNSANEKMKDAVTVPKPPVLRPGVSRSKGEVELERLDRLHDRFQSQTGEQQLQTAVRLLQERRRAASR